MPPAATAAAAPPAASGASLPPLVLPPPPVPAPPTGSTPADGLLVATGVTEAAGAGGAEEAGAVGTTLGVGLVGGVVGGVVCMHVQVGLGLAGGVLGGGVWCMQVQVGLGLEDGDEPPLGWWATDAEAALLNITVDPAARSGTLSAAVAIILRGRLDRKFIYFRSFSVCLFRWLRPVRSSGPAARPVAQHGVTSQLRTRNSRHISVFRSCRLRRVIIPESVTPFPLPREAFSGAGQLIDPLTRYCDRTSHFMRM